ncbi:Fe-S cluster assembly ATPase SufC [Mycoplasmatota bacterium]|nr:Fe-S cluster assembly ATPase SufC [Mycoplasmatota bacterium]
MKPVLNIKNLHVNVEDKEILKGVDLKMQGGEIHVIMGPNGTGKSTLSSAIMGNPKYHVTEGEISLNNENVVDMPVDERARKGLFLAMQYPSEVPGVTNSDFIRTAMQSKTGKSIPLYKFIMDYDKAIEKLQMRSDLPHRYLNDGFSGGEKKRNEILQMLMLKPNFAILDEIDSGLDVDALRIVGEAVNSMRSDSFGCLLITHYQRILDYIKPDIIHVMMKGKIVKTGGLELMERIDKEGYDWIKEELGIVDEKVIPEETNQRPVMIGECATKKSLDL